MTRTKIFTMEMIFGVIEDLIEKFEAGDPDAASSLKSNMSQFISNLEGLGTPDANSLLEKLKSLNLG
jgi:hypothetical protein